MADSFDLEVAKERHQNMIRQTQEIRDGLTKDVIDYYYNSPTTEVQERETNTGMRRYLEIARDRINQLLDNNLY
jgi:hypothetical protein